ncbi:hypothetical protein K6979_14015 [Xanthomonas cucurbitae]|uniref:hypothetical protein n=1 Tax=Xanthomonas cucurbitae TaxID=56453 RepID=UPI0013047E01|nr:hypothetical protein [Xanthomonas cucurbitae]WDM78283.1 hypothetical protein K6980_14010 [Xanthomonas cucurbitae]WDM81964.1 hypothetical protein K6979_14015 [Xanthomonas cucurbitae]
MKGKAKQAQLDAIAVKGKVHDFVDVLENFLNVHSAAYDTFLVHRSNRLIRILDVRKNKLGRDIGFYISSGTFGIPGDIIDSKSKKKNSSEAIW